MSNKLFENGRFFLGCNWWASHAGTNMWQEWNEAVVEDDFRRLADAKITVVRVFPLWSDFQPLRMHFGGGQTPREIRLGEIPLPETEAGRAGIDEIMVERFSTLCDIAERYGIRLIVGLITGWMSGRMHTPEAFLGKDLLRDPLVVSWQVRFVKYMVRHFKDRAAIAAWDLGNECNCMSSGLSRSECYVWASQITNAIKADDASRPVISGMHGTLPSDASVWNSRDLGEILDVLCTHPYPLFTPHCNTDPINGMKSALHATAESVMYASTAGKPCFIEEAGTLGPIVSSEKIAGDYVRASAFSAWAHGLYGFVWWCANEQSALTHTPYDWESIERELGFFRIDGSKKPVLESMSELASFIEGLDFDALPERITDAVCILTHGQDVWANAYGSFILAKQAGLDVTFAWCEDKIPEAKTYMLPGLSGLSPLSLHKYRELLERVSEGATLYISINDGALSQFKEVTGLEVQTRAMRTRAESVTLDGGEVLPFGADMKLTLKNIGAKVLLESSDGNPAVSEYGYGKGRICFVNSPIEYHTATRAGVVSGESAVPYYKLYELLSLDGGKRIASCKSPYIGLTEHPVSDGERIITVLNHTPEALDAVITLDGGYKLQKVYNVHGITEVSEQDGKLLFTIEGNVGLALRIKKV